MTASIQLTILKVKLQPSVVENNMENYRNIVRCNQNELCEIVENNKMSISNCINFSHLTLSGKF